jgi:dipeptidyl aminopeptidase/acylaminoacyl peptidase
MSHTRIDFRLVHPRESWRVVRGRATVPAGASPSSPVPFVLVLHGFKGFMDWGFFPLLTERLADAGFAAVAFNTSCGGVGDDLESFTEEQAFERDTCTRQLEDVQLVRAHVAEGVFPGVDPHRAGLFGHSRGGGIALVHAADRGDYRALALWAAVDDLDRLDEPTKVAWRQEGRLPVVNARTGQTLYIGLEMLDDLEQNRERLDVQAACGRIEAPTLLVHGEADPSVSFESLGNLERSLPDRVGRALAVPGAGHTFGAKHPLDEVPSDLSEVLRETEEWFRRHLA